MRSLGRAEQYLESEVLTAGPGRLLLITYAGLLRSLTQAKEALGAGDYHAKHTAVARAQALLLELRRTLHPEACPEVAAGLAAIYTYLLEQLARADAEDDEARLAHVAAIISDLRDTWAQAERVVRMAAGGQGAEV